MQIFLACGFDSELSFSSVAPETIISEIEQYVNENLSILKNTSYEGVEYFKFKPGHKSFILNFPNRLKEVKCEGIQSKTSDFSCILRTYIETAEANFGKDPKGFRYSETNRYFSTFIYLMCGKSCYETLSANLPFLKRLQFVSSTCIFSSSCASINSRMLCIYSRLH